jgi:hypothetical protein
MGSGKKRYYKPMVISLFTGKQSGNRDIYVLADVCCVVNLEKSVSGRITEVDIEWIYLIQIPCRN